VTNDKDFGELVFRSGQAHGGIVLLRLRDESSDNRVRVMQTVLNQYGEALPGHFVVASESHSDSCGTLNGHGNRLDAFAALRRAVTAQVRYQRSLLANQPAAHLVREMQA
jgi:hypothetical protein